MSDHEARAVGEERRFGELSVDEMSTEQRSINDWLVAYVHPEQVGTGATIGGPMAALLHSPPLADLVGRMVTFFFDEISVPRATNEVSILLTARHWSCDYEFHTHRRYATRLGIAPAVIDAIEVGARPVLEGELDDVYEFVSQLLRDGDVTDDAFGRVAGRWGRQGAVELIATVGFYTMLAFVLNVDRYPVPEESGGRPLPVFDESRVDAPAMGRGRSGSVGLERRFGEMATDAMDVTQRAVNDSLVNHLHPEQAGSGRAIGGSMAALLHSPRLAELVGRMVVLVFDGLAVPRVATEVTVLVTARHWDCHFLLHMHRRLAMELGVDSAVVLAIDAGVRPTLDGELEDVYEFASQLVRDGDVSNEAFGRVVGRWGRRGAVELLATVGFYSTLALVLNVDRHPVPADGSPSAEGPD